MFKSGLKYHCDKVTHHGYDRFYEYFLHPLKHSEINVFEIGIDAGRSLKMWTDYFSKAKIYGLDINQGYKHERGTIFKGDQSNIEHINLSIEYVKNAKVIIDDGSHVPEHQLLCFNVLFNKLLDFCGIYIIEDIETSYWKKGDLYGYKIESGYKSDNNIVKIFSSIIDIVNREFLLDDEKSLLNNLGIDEECLKLISFITFGQNCIIIKKMSKTEFKKFGQRKYRYEDNLK